MRLLLISNSTNAGEAYLEYPLGEIRAFLGGIDRVAFIPYAAVTFSFDAYRDKVQARLGELGVAVRSVHEAADPVRAIGRAKAIVVGGGNTFQLTKMMQERGLMEAVAERVRAGVPYVGWSAGANVACPTICTTNDMPIVEPRSFGATGLVPFQINPHYLDAHPDGHAGETRAQRIEEYTRANPEATVVGLREGCMLRREGRRLTLVGPRPLRLFRHATIPRECPPGDVSFLLGE